MIGNKNLWADIREHGIIWASKKHDIPKSTLYYRVKRLGKEEEIEQEIWEFKKVHPKSTNKKIKEKLKIHFSISKISRIINKYWIEEFPLWERKYGSLKRMINDPKARQFLLIKPRFRIIITSIDQLINRNKRLFQKMLLSHPGKSRTTLKSDLKEFFTYLSAEDEKARSGLLLHLPQFDPGKEDQVDVEWRLWGVIKYRYRIMKKIDEVCLKNGINLKNMVKDRNKVREAAFIIYHLKRALRYKFKKSWGAKSLQEVLDICKLISDLATLTISIKEPALEVKE